MVVETFPDGKLGGDLKTVAALQRGKIDLTVTNSGLLSGLVKGFVFLIFLLSSAVWMRQMRLSMAPSDKTS